MNIEEANKTIAEFMGKKYYTCLEWNKLFGTKNEPIGTNGLSFIIHDYYCSLDALVPVWEKLEFREIKINKALRFDDDNDLWIWLSVNLHHQVISKTLTIQQAACIATAKAIKELGVL